MSRPFRHDGVGDFMGFRQQEPGEIHLTIRPELINRGGMLSGVVAFALLDYAMGSALWAQRNEGESIATINIAINYVQSATQGDVVCRARVDRRNRRIAVLRGEVEHEDGRLMATAVGSYSIFPAR